MTQTFEGSLSKKEMSAYFCANFCSGQLLYLCIDVAIKVQSHTYKV